MSARVSRLDTLLFEQCDVPRRLAWVRVVLGACVLVLAAWGPFGSFFAEQRWLYEPRGLFTWFPSLGQLELLALRSVTAASALLLAVGLRTRLMAWLCAVSFFCLNGYTAQFTQLAFNL